uniref:Calpastatin n=1 Tax=Salmo trutta TaxID=8032 RepID=A0A673Z960_SALTR
MSTDEALDSLSFGFTTSMAPIPQKQEKKVEDLGAIDALSAGFSNFAPPPPAPIKKAEEFKSAPVTKCPAPPTDKKAKVEKLADDFSLMSGLDSPLDTKLKTAESVPTTSSKVDMAKKDPAKLVTAVAAPAAAAGDASLKGPQTKVQVEVVPPGAKAAKEELAVDPFDALADSLPSSESFAPAAHVYTGPEVIEHGLTSKKGVICGGDDCPLPPGYRFEDMVSL